MTRSGYQLGDFDDVGQEVLRLQAQARVVADLEDEAYLALGIPERGTGVDLGCGPGFVAARLRRLRPGLTMFGVDVDGQTLLRASPLLAVARADLLQLPFRSGAFDFAFSRLVLRHVSEPATALAEVARVLRPGGVVMIEDCDDGSIVLDPEPPNFQTVLQARHAALRRRGADPFLARHLPALLRALPFHPVQVRALPVTSEQIGVEAFAKIVLAPATEAIDDDLLPRDTVLDARRHIEAWSKAPSSFGMTTALVMRGVRT